LLVGVRTTTVRLASTSNINISSPGSTIGGATANTTDRVLLTAQTTGSQNGIYVFNGPSSAMTRASDFDASSEFMSGMLVTVSAGSNAGTVWELATTGTITLGSTTLTFQAKTGGVSGLAVDSAVVHKGDLVINPLDTAYGAVGDGTTDDRAKLLAAANAAVAAGVELFLPGGRTYQVASTLALPSGCRLISPGARIRGAIVGSSVVTVGSDTTISGVKVENTDTSTGNIDIGVRGNSQHIKIRKCEFYGSKAQAVSVGSSGCSDIEVVNNLFDGVNYGLQLQRHDRRA
jgi:polygalacturonase